MQAISIAAHGGPDVLRVVDLAIPTPTADQVLVRNHAIGVNFVDVQHRQGGIYAVALPLIPGIEAAGVVAAVGPGATAFRPGDRVAYAGYMGGDYAEYTLVVEGHLFPVPDAIDFETAAAISLQGITAYTLTHPVYPVQPGDWVLIHAAAGGVGGLLLQIVKHLGARPIAVVSTEAKAWFAREHGAEHAILYSKGDMVHTIDRLTNGAGVHVAYDAVGRDTFDASLASLRKRGTLVVYGLSSGPVPPFDINRLSGITPGSGRGSLSLIWAAASHYIEDRQELLAQTRAVFDLVQAGSLRPTIAERLPLAEAAQAHRLLESRAVVGKLLLIPQGRWRSDFSRGEALQLSRGGCPQGASTLATGPWTLAMKLRSTILTVLLVLGLLTACAPAAPAAQTTAQWLLIGVVSADGRATQAVVPVSCVLSGADCAAETDFYYTKLAIASGDVGARDAASGDLLIAAQKEPTHLFRVAADGTATDLSSAGEAVGQIVPAPDGALVAYERSVGGADEVWLMRSDGGEARALTAGVAPAWAPDGQSLVVARSTPDGAGRDLWLVPVTGGEARQLTDTPAVIEQDVVFSPDGALLAFGAADPATGATHVNTLSLAPGSQPADVTEGAVYVSPISFDPTGQTILVGMVADDVLKLTLVDLNGNALTAVPIDRRNSQGDGGADAAAWLSRSQIVFIRRLNGLTYVYTYDFASGKAAKVLDASVVTPGSAITSLRLAP